jgi:hypothetical protein
MNFFTVIGAHTPCQPNRHSGEGRFIEISLLDRPDDHPQISEQLSLLLERAPEATDRSRQSFIDACGELMSNIRHAYVPNGETAERRPPAIIQAQYYPKKSEVEFCICDAGIGIKASLEAAYDQLRSHLEAIDIASACRNHNENGEGAGIGLAALQTYAKKNHGELSIRSGDALKRQRHRNLFGMNDLPLWNGTIVTMRINVESEVDLSRIFDRMAGNDD